MFIILSGPGEREDTRLRKQSVMATSSWGGDLHLLLRPDIAASMSVSRRKPSFCQSKRLARSYRPP